MLVGAVVGPFVYLCWLVCLSVCVLLCFAWDRKDVAYNKKQQTKIANREQQLQLKLTVTTTNKHKHTTTYNHKPQLQRRFVCPGSGGKQTNKQTNKQQTKTQQTNKRERKQANRKRNNKQIKPALRRKQSIDSQSKQTNKQANKARKTNHKAGRAGPCKTDTLSNSIGKVKAAP